MGSEIDRSQQERVLIIAGVSTGLSALVITLRFISRFYLTKWPGVDDWLMLGGFIAVVSLTAETIVDTHYGLGLHLANFDFSWFIPYLKLFFSTEISYHVSMSFIKASILSFYLRFLPPETLTRRLTWVTMVFVTLFNIINILVLCLQCIPLQKYWDQSVPGSCTDLMVLYYFSASYNIATDVAIFALPIKTIIKMRSSWNDKIMLLCLFGVMLFACVVSCVRLESLTAFVYGTDSTWDIVELNIWSHIEIASAILCGSIPALKPLFVRRKKKDNDLSMRMPGTGTLELNEWNDDKDVNAETMAASTSS